jgi:hypothetical protein
MNFKIPDSFLEEDYIIRVYGYDIWHEFELICEEKFVNLFDLDYQKFQEILNLAQLRFL